MKIVAVVGTGSGCGKTTVACRILSAHPGLGAVKISPREGTTRVEWGPGKPGKDTDRYAGSGAVKVARIVGPRDEVGAVWETIKGQFEGCRGVVIEGTSALGLSGERFVVFVAGTTVEKAREEHSGAIATTADLLVDRSSSTGAESSAPQLKAFLSGIADT